MVPFQTFIGGIFDTNCYFVQAPEGDLLIDAPAGTLGWLKESGFTPRLLLITHGHVDHIEDAAKIKRTFGCPVAYHEASLPLITDPDFFKKFGFFLQAETVAPDFLVEESENSQFLGLNFQVLLVPGHCPGSLCFYAKDHGLLFGGDVLFAGSIGRTDLPGGDFELLVRGIKTKVFRLPNETRVLSGHGPATTIGQEKRSNPFVGEP